MAVAGGPYSAGSVFVQVIPSFRNFQNRIKQEVEVLDKALGKEMEASGKKAGRAAGKAVAKEMKGEVAKAQVGSDDIKVDVGAIRRKIQASANEAARDLGGNSIFKDAVSDLFDISKAIDDNEDVDVTFLAEMLEDAAKKIEKIGANKISVEASMDASKALAKIKPQVKAIETAARGEIEFKAKADLSSAKATVVDSLDAAMREIGGNRQLSEARDRMADFRNSIVNGDDIDLPKLRSTMEEVSAIMAKAYTGEKATWSTHFEAPRAMAQIQRALDKIDPPVIEPEIELTETQKFKKSLEEGFEKSLDALGDERHIRKVRKKMEDGLKGLRAEPELDLTRTREQLDGLIREFASAAIAAPTSSAREKSAGVVASLRGMRGDIDKRMPEITGKDLGADQLSIDLQNAIKKAIKAAGDSPETEAFRRQLKDIDVKVKLKTIGKREAIAELRQIEWAAKGISLNREGKISIEGITEARRTYESLNSTLNKIGVDTNKQHNAIERFGHAVQGMGNKAGRAGSGVRMLGRGISRLGSEFSQSERFVSRVRTGLSQLGFSTLGVGHAIARTGSTIAMVIPLLPLLSAGIVSLTYALGAIAPAAASAVGSLAVLGIGFSGVIGGVKALQQQQDAAPMDASKAQKKALQNRISELRRQLADEKRAEQANKRRITQEKRIAKAKNAVEKADTRATRVQVDNARRLADAQKSAAESVKRARESAAKANEQALKREADAQKRVARQVEQVREAEARLREAREAAKNKGKDIARDIKKNKLQEDAGVVALFDADVAYKSTMADGSATNRDKELARIALEEARMSLEDIRAEGARLAEEQSEWNRTGVDGTEEVKSAKESVASAVENQREAEAEAAEASKEAIQTRIDGERAVAEAVAESAERIRAVREENAQRLADAQTSLGEKVAAEEDIIAAPIAGESSSSGTQRMLDDAIRDLENFDQLTSSQAKVASEFDKMGAAGQRFARFIHSLGPSFKALRDEIQSAMLPAAERAIRTFLDSSNSSTLADSLVAMAEGWGILFERLGESLAGPAWGRFFEMMGKEGVLMQENYGTGLIYFFEGLAGLLSALAPSAVSFSEGFANLMERFAEWANSPKGQQEIMDFMTTARDVGGPVGSILWEITKALWNLAIAMAPFGVKALEGLRWFLTLDHEILKGLAIGIGLVATAFLIAAAAANLPVAAVVAVVAILTWAYVKFEWFRKAVDFVFLVLWTGLKRVGEMTINILKAIVDGLKWFVRKNIEWFRHARDTWGSFTSFVDRQGKRIGGFFDRLGSKIMSFGRDTMGKAMSAGRSAIEGLKNATRTALDAMGNKWDELKAKTARPIKFVIEKVINAGMIAGFNKLGEHLPGKPRIPEVPVPKWIQKYATGGILPGYTPGRDVHRFVSPTGGLLDLSGGEAILRPEVTSALGADWVNKVNAAARRGGVAGVRTAVATRQAFAGGGIFAPVPGRINRHSKAQYPWANISGDYPVPMGTPIRAYMDGIIASVKRLATSYGHHVRINHPNGTQTLYAHMSRIIAGQVGQQVKGGQVIGLVGSTGNSSGPHLHFEHKGGHGFPGAGQGGGGGVLSSLAGAVMNFLGKPLETVKGWASDKLDSFKKSFGDSTFSKAIGSIPSMVFGRLKDKITGLIPNDDGMDLSGLGSGVAAGAIAGAKGAAKWKDVALQAMKMAGLPTSYLPLLLHRMNVESGGNPRAVNNWDINARRGTPSKGLMQTIGPTFNAYAGALRSRGIFDPLANIYAAIQYTKSRYGIAGIPRAWGGRKGYATGGILPDFGGQRYNGSVLRDTGGPLQPGITTVVNKTGKAEQVYTAEQHAAAQAALAATSRGALATGYNGPAVKVDVTGLSETQAANAMAGELNYQIRQINRRGRYS